jgi:hypothetical protein
MAQAWANDESPFLLDNEHTKIIEISFGCNGEKDTYCIAIIYWTKDQRLYSTQGWRRMSKLRSQGKRGQ